MKIMSVIRIDNNEEVILIPEAVLDISAGCLLHNKAVFIKDGCINALIDRDKVDNFTHERTAKIISLNGLTLLPGLIDCHVHFALDGTSFKGATGRWKEPKIMVDYMRVALYDHLRHGVVAVRDGSDIFGYGLKARNMVCDEGFSGPSVLATGFAIRKDGRYGTFLGTGINDISEAKNQISDLVNLNVDQIKVTVSGIVSFKEYGKVGPVQFSLSELQSIVNESHENGLRVMAHASSDEAVRLAAEAGVDSIEHGYFVSDSSLDLMAHKGIAWIPTVVPIAIQTIDPWRNSYSFEEYSIIERTYKLQLMQVKKAAELGVLLGVGTDAGAIGVRPGISYFDELQLYKDAGLSTLEIISAATQNGSRILGLDKDLGGIEPGKKPNFIAVKGNPLDDLDLLKHVEYTICL